MKRRLMESPYFAKSLFTLAKLISGKDNDIGLKMMITLYFPFHSFIVTEVLSFGFLMPESMY